LFPLPLDTKWTIARSGNFRVMATSYHIPFHMSHLPVASSLFIHKFLPFSFASLYSAFCLLQFQLVSRFSCWWLHSNTFSFICLDSWRKAFPFWVIPQFSFADSSELGGGGGGWGWLSHPLSKNHQPTAVLSMTHTESQLWMLRDREKGGERERNFSLLDESYMWVAFFTLPPPHHT